MSSINSSVSSNGAIPDQVVLADLATSQTVTDLNSQAAQPWAPPASGVQTPTAPDPFNPASLALPQDFGSVGVKKTLTTVPVRKPSKELFFQVHPGPEYRLQTCVIELKEDNEIYLVAPGLRSELFGEATFGVRDICTCITRQGITFLWALRMPGVDGKIDPWSASALDAAQRAQGNWIRMVSNRELGAYEVFEPTFVLSPPVWPDKTFEELLRTAFRNRFIDTMDHIVLKRLRGEV